MVGVQWGQSYFMGGGGSLTLVGQPSSGYITVKIRYSVDILSHRPALQSFPIELAKTKSDFAVRSVETGLGR